MPSNLTVKNHNNLLNLCTNLKVTRNKIYKHNPRKLTASAHAKSNEGKGHNILTTQSSMHH